MRCVIAEYFLRKSLSESVDPRRSASLDNFAAKDKILNMVFHPGFVHLAYTIDAAQLVLFPRIPIGDTDPQAQPIETIVDALLRIDRLVAHIKLSLGQSHTRTGPSWTQVVGFEGMLLAALFALCGELILNITYVLWPQFNVVYILWPSCSPVSCDTLVVRPGAPPTESACPSSCTAASCAAPHQRPPPPSHWFVDPLANRQSRPVAARSVRPPLPRRPQSFHPIRTTHSRSLPVCHSLYSALDGQRLCPLRCRTPSRIQARRTAATRWIWP